jgi:hypothetical protein
LAKNPVLKLWLYRGPPGWPKGLLFNDGFCSIMTFVEHPRQFIAIKRRKEEGIYVLLVL